MSRKIEESNLEQAVTHASEPGMLSAVSADTVAAKRTAMKKAGRTEQQATLGERSMKAKRAGAARMTKPKKANQATTNTKSRVKTRTVKTKAVVSVNAPEETTTTVGETVPSVDAGPQEQLLFQGMGESAGVEAHVGSDSSAIREIYFEAEIVVPDENVNEKEAIFPSEELEVITDRVHIHPVTQGRSVTILRWLTGAWKWAQRLGARHPRKRLRVCETVALGEKRFVAVIEVDGEQFLVGGGSTSVATLARLEPTQQFADVLKRRWAQEPVQA